MLKFFNAIFKAILAIFPVIEVIFLSLYIGSYFGPAATIVIFIVLLISSYFWGFIVKPLAWGVLGFVLINNNSSLINAMIIGGMFATVRFLVAFGLKKIR
ncbi:hypothetical protein ACFO25_04610 [Paenactinomyces guangxiensis]|uniref:Uncharacterized protein n=1 Tax=Paenactinomyces guangxiensis TaxID=1490290 RepID=A0A7W1WPF2_9BACL|nr:hypothetical protein [Paenactinomyces guangxiensis]MBA4493659.1 hypothetical protein [Paenactinomyces guangxiensis]MBH8590946.1 hypothetical protein [Paenactinomyces guangxiensis]